ncbi:hypothetical protein RhiirA5_424753 [Rhizophagus irregularis]|uniref:Uncharacterized protein n=1 Tax=Rhizophagus irregularis TaxID=588596 RepID=A0A2N0P7I6_9GLOM|nr:hypothetical protein RhiirA5_424753 [Rhizophagus irregularis]
MIQVVIQPLMIPITKTWMKMWEDADDVYEELGEINTSEFKDLFSTLSNNKSDRTLNSMTKRIFKFTHEELGRNSGQRKRTTEDLQIASAGEKKVDEGLLNQELIQDEGDDSCDEKVNMTLNYAYTYHPIRSNEEGIPPGQQVDVEGSLQSPNYTQANSNEEASSGERT